MATTTVRRGSLNWENTEQDKMYAAVTKTHELQHEFLAAQRDAAKAVCRPSFMLKPVLVNTGAEFLAIYGDVKAAGQHIVGRGATPEAALQDFDETFKRGPESQVVIAPATKKPKTK